MSALVDEQRLEAARPTADCAPPHDQAAHHERDHAVAAHAQDDLVPGLLQRHHHAGAHRRHPRPRARPREGRRGRRHRLQRAHRRSTSSTRTVHTAHGRALAVATGVKAADPSLHVIVAMGDGDCSAIGGNHFIHAARRNVDVTALVFNNSIYGMTGGQMSPTTHTGDKSTTSVLRQRRGRVRPLRAGARRGSDLRRPRHRLGLPPARRRHRRRHRPQGLLARRGHGRVPRVLRALQPHAPTPPSSSRARRSTPCRRASSRRASRASASGTRSASCTTASAPSSSPRWQTIGRARRRRPRMADATGRRDRWRSASPAPAARASCSPRPSSPRRPPPWASTSSQTQSYGPAARGGASKAEVIVSDEEIDYPEVDAPDVSLCLSQAAYDKYAADTRPGGLLVYDSGLVEPDGRLARPRAVRPARSRRPSAEHLKKTVVANIVAVGALVEVTGVLPADAVEQAVVNRVPGALPRAQRRGLPARAPAGRRGRETARERSRPRRAPHALAEGDDRGPARASGQGAVRRRRAAGPAARAWRLAGTRPRRRPRARPAGRRQGAGQDRRPRQGRRHPRLRRPPPRSPRPPRTCSA